jgi:hypothetical protein
MCPLCGITSEAKILLKKGATLKLNTIQRKSKGRV